MVNIQSGAGQQIKESVTYQHRVLHLNFELCVAEESSVFWGKDS